MARRVIEAPACSVEQIDAADEEREVRTAAPGDPSPVRPEAHAPGAVERNHHELGRPYRHGLRLRYRLGARKEPHDSAAQRPCPTVCHGRCQADGQERRCEQKSGSARPAPRLSPQPPPTWTMLFHAPIVADDGRPPVDGRFRRSGHEATVRAATLRHPQPHAAHRATPGQRCGAGSRAEAARRPARPRLRGHRAAAATESGVIANGTSAAARETGPLTQGDLTRGLSRSGLSRAAACGVAEATSRLEHTPRAPTEVGRRRARDAELWRAGRAPELGLRPQPQPVLVPQSRQV
jgi:hypothetical protein